MQTSLCINKDTCMHKWILMATIYRSETHVVYRTAVKGTVHDTPATLIEALATEMRANGYDCWVGENFLIILGELGDCELRIELLPPNQLFSIENLVAQYWHKREKKLPLIAELAVLIGMSSWSVKIKTPKITTEAIGNRGDIFWRLVYEAIMKQRKGGAPILVTKNGIEISDTEFELQLLLPNKQIFYAQASQNGRIDIPDFEHILTTYGNCQ